MQVGPFADISIDDGELIFPAHNKIYSLDELLKNVKWDNLHGEIDFDSPVGLEIFEYVEFASASAFTIRS